MVEPEAPRPAERASRQQERVVAEFRAGGGKVGGYHAGMSLLLLTTKGARTGERRATPLTYVTDGRRYVVAAANAGAPANPDWYHNLIANPGVTVEIGGETFGATAAATMGAQRDELFRRYTAAYPQLAAYQARTAREIPIVVITRPPLDATAC